jgi:hypothetical protein
MKNVLDYITPEMIYEMRTGSFQCVFGEFTDEEIKSAFLEHETHKEKWIESSIKNTGIARWRGSWDVIENKHDALMCATLREYIKTLMERGLISDKSL